MNLVHIDRIRFHAFLLSGAMMLLCGCGASNHQGNLPASNPAPLSTTNINLIFVVSADLQYQASGDVNADTANLTAQGLQRTLLMAPYLQHAVLGNQNVSAIYALEPMTHLQTSSGYPDMTALETVQQFALMNQFTMMSPYPEMESTTGNSFPINSSYVPGSEPDGVIAPSPSYPCPACQGIDFNNTGSDNDALLAGIVSAKEPGYYVFSAPWETTQTLLASLNALEQSSLSPPSQYQGPNIVYAVSIAPSGTASLTTYDGNLKPPNPYPKLDPEPVAPAPCQYSTFSLKATGPPANINTNETLYFIRHANAHPSLVFSNGNFVAAGQWRALGLGNAISKALEGRPQPTHVYSLDPAQVTPNAGLTAAGPTSFSHNTLAMTAEPYAIAKNLPYSLVSSFLLTDKNGPQEASNYFFQGGQFTNKNILVAWEHTNIPQILSALLASYNNVSSAPPLAWDAYDYDSIWTVTIDGGGNLAANNSLCEGIDSENLPATAPQF
ncbi:MAG: hypothetical protein WBV28_20475 [Terracidiphilus sp.]